MRARNVREAIMVSLQGRKFFLTILTLFTMTLLVWFLKISDAVYRDIIIATVAVYISGNVAQHIFEPKLPKENNDGPN